MQDGRAITAASVRECCYKLSKKKTTLNHPCHFQTLVCENAQLGRQGGGMLCVMEKKKMVRFPGETRTIRKGRRHGRDGKIGKSSIQKGRKNKRQQEHENRTNIEIKKLGIIIPIIKNLCFSVVKITAFQKYFLQANVFCSCHILLLWEAGSDLNNIKDDSKIPIKNTTIVLQQLQFHDTITVSKFLVWVQ